jgi:hypothetical protein
MALVGTMATILGVFITIYGIINNRTLKAEAKNVREILLGEAKSTKEIILEETRGIREILLRIEQGQDEARREMAEAIKYLADLIHMDGERTREVVRAKP